MGAKIRFAAPGMERLPTLCKPLRWQAGPV